MEIGGKGGRVLQFHETMIVMQQIIEGCVTMVVIDGARVGQHVIHITADIALILVAVTIVAQDLAPGNDMAVGLYLGAGDRVQYMQTRSQPMGLEVGSHSCCLVTLPTAMILIDILEQILTAVSNKRVIANRGAQSAIGFAFKLASAKEKSRLQ